METFNWKMLTCCGKQVFDVYVDATALMIKLFRHELQYNEEHYKWL